MVFAATLLLFAGATHPQPESTLLSALDLERQGDAFRAAAVVKFGNVAPLKAYRAGQDGEKALTVAFSKIGGGAPANPYARQKTESSKTWADRLGVPKTLFEAAELAAKFEARAASTYDGLAKADPDNAALMANLAALSLQREKALTHFLTKSCCGSGD